MQHIGRLSFSLIIFIFVGVSCAFSPIMTSQIETFKPTESVLSKEPLTLLEKPQKMIHFRSDVQVHLLDDLNASEVNEIEQMFREDGLEQTWVGGADSEADFETASSRYSLPVRHQPRIFITHFRSHVSRFIPPFNIKIAQGTPFKLILQAGPYYRILDSDATDGEARIQLPEGTFDTLFHLQGAWRKHKGALEVIDPLYYLEDSITAGRFGNWFRLGLRPLPVPTAWGSADGEVFVLELNAQDLDDFQMVWLRKNTKPEFPPGLNEIGSAGGTVTLPGVASLDIPANALNEETLVRLSQVEEAVSIEEICEPRFLAETPCVPGLDFVSPVLKIEPLSLTLNQIAELHLKTYTERLGNNHPGLMRFKANHSSEIEPSDWLFDALAPSLGSAVNASAESPIRIKTFAHVAKFIPTVMAPDDQAQIYDSAKYNLRLQEKASGISDTEAQNQLAQLSAALDAYTDLGLPAPQPWLQEWSNDLVLPVVLHQSGQSAGLSDIFAPNQAPESAAYLGSKITLRQCLADGSACNGFASTEQLGKDAFHLIQQSYYQNQPGLSYADYLKNLSFDATNELNQENRWFLKSSAALMGLYFAQDIQGLSADNHSAYLGALNQSQYGIQTALNISHSSEQYNAIGFLSHLAMLNGIESLAEMTTNYGAALTNTDTDSGSAALSALQNSVSDYGLYAQDSFLGRSLNLIPNQTQDSVPTQVFKLKGSHTEASPLIIEAELQGLSAQHVLIQPDTDWPEGQAVYVRLKTLTSFSETLIPNVNAQDFFQASLLKRSTSNGSASFATITATGQEIESFGPASTVQELALVLANSYAQSNATPEAKLRVQIELYTEASIVTPPEGEIAWQLNLEGKAVSENAAPLVYDNKLYLVDSIYGSSIRIVDASTGEELNFIEWGSPIDFSPTLGSDGSLYFGTTDGYFNALDADGEYLWEFYTEAPESFRNGGAALDEASGQIFAGGEGEKLYAFNLTDGSLNWSFKGRAPIVGAPIVTSERVYYLGMDQTLYALDKTTGIYLWEFQTAKIIRNLYPALTEAEEIVFGSEDKWLYSVDHEGFENWSYVMDAGMAVGPVISPERTTYAIDSVGNIYAVNVLGDLKWRHHTGAEIHSAPVIGNTGTLYVGNDAGQVSAIGPEGQDYWQIQVNGAVTGALTLDEQGMLYGVTAAGEVFAIQTSSTGLAEGEWPKSQGDLRNTGAKP